MRHVNNQRGPKRHTLSDAASKRQLMATIHMRAQRRNDNSRSPFSDFMAYSRQRLMKRCPLRLHLQPSSAPLPVLAIADANAPNTSLHELHLACRWGHCSPLAVPSPNVQRHLSCSLVPLTFTAPRPPPSCMLYIPGHSPNPAHRSRQDHSPVAHLATGDAQCTNSHTLPCFDRLHFAALSRSLCSVCLRRVKDMRTFVLRSWHW